MQVEEVTQEAPVGKDFQYFELLDEMFRDVGEERFAPDEVQMAPILSGEVDGEEQRRIGVMYLYNPPTHALQVVITVESKEVIDPESLETFPVESDVWVDQYKEHPDPTMYMQVKGIVDRLLAKDFTVEKVFQLDLEKASTEEKDYTGMVSFPVAMMANPEGHTALILASPTYP